jgi:hypothetical protein
MGRPLTKLHRAHYLSPSDSLKYVQVPHQVPSRIDPCLKRMTVQDFVAKTSAKAKTDSARLNGLQVLFYRQAPNMPKSVRSPVRHFTARQSRLYSPTRIGSARYATFGACKDKCIQTH